MQERLHHGTQENTQFQEQRPAAPQDVVNSKFSPAQRHVARGQRQRLDHSSFHSPTGHALAAPGQRQNTTEAGDELLNTSSVKERLEQHVCPLGNENTRLLASELEITIVFPKQ